MKKCPKCKHSIIPQIGYCILCNTNNVESVVDKSIILTIDLSGSMSGPFLDDAKQAAIDFVERIDCRICKISITGFADSYNVFCEFTNDKEKLKKSILGLSIGANLGYGNRNNPLQSAYPVFQESKKRSKCLMIIVTDGVWSSPNRAIAVSDKYRAERVDVFAYGIGRADYKFLQRIATCDESAIKTVSSEMSKNFLSIADEINKTGSFVK